MSPKASPLLGYNNNVRHKGHVFHIQTEDSGVRYGHVITHLFMDGGRILKSVKTSYAEHVASERRSEIVRELMKEQHKAMFIALRDGVFDAALAGTAAPAPSQRSQSTEVVPSRAPAAARGEATPSRAPADVGAEVTPSRSSAVARAEATPSRAPAGTARSVPAGIASGRPSAGEGGGRRVSTPLYPSARRSSAPGAARLAVERPQLAVDQAQRPESASAIRARSELPAAPVAEGAAVPRADSAGSIRTESSEAILANATGAARTGSAGSIRADAASSSRMMSTTPSTSARGSTPRLAKSVPAGAQDGGAGDRRAPPARPASSFGQARPQQGKTIFGEDPMSNKSLDEVILSYLSAELDEKKP